MQARLLKHLHDHNILSNEQYGFRTKLKTYNATYQLTNEILNALHNKVLIEHVFFLTYKRYLTASITKFYYLNLNSMHNW